VGTYRLIAVRGVLLFALVAGCANTDVQTDSFATMAEARQRGAVDRGWVPGFLPERAYEIRAAYDTDGPRRWGILNFRPEDADSVRRVLKPGEVSLAGFRTNIPARIEWWPIALRNELDAAALAATGLRTYRSSTGEYVFVVNWNQGRAYYWWAGDGA
jgi:hypothetical protein